MASVGKSCACWVLSGGVSGLFILYKGEDSAERVPLITTDFSHLEKEMISRERSSAPLVHSAFNFIVSVSGCPFVSSKACLSIHPPLQTASLNLHLPRVHPCAPSKNCLLLLYNVIVLRMQWGHSKKRMLGVARQLPDTPARSSHVIINRTSKISSGIRFNLIPKEISEVRLMMMWDEGAGLSYS